MVFKELNQFFLCFKEIQFPFYLIYFCKICWCYNIMWSHRASHTKRHADLTRGMLIWPLISNCLLTPVTPKPLSYNWFLTPKATWCFHRRKNKENVTLIQHKTLRINIYMPNCCIHRMINSKSSECLVVQNSAILFKCWHIKTQSVSSKWQILHRFLEVPSK